MEVSGHQVKKQLRWALKLPTAFTEPPGAGDEEEPTPLPLQQGQRVVYFHLYEISKVVKAKEGKSTWEVSMGWKNW